ASDRRTAPAARRRVPQASSTQYRTDVLDEQAGASGTSRRSLWGELAGRRPVRRGIRPHRGPAVHRLLHQIRPPRVHQFRRRWTAGRLASVQSALPCVYWSPAAPDSSGATWSTRSSRAAIGSLWSTISPRATAPTSTGGPSSASPTPPPAAR